MSDASACQAAPSPQPLLLAGIGLVALSGCLLATQDALVKDLATRHSPFQIGVLRFTLHGIFVALILSAAGQRRIWRTSRPGLHLARACGLLGASMCMHVALIHVPLSQATVIQFLSPLVVTLLSVLFLGETIGWRRSTALVAGFSGVLAIMAPKLEGGGLSLYWALPLGSAVSSAVYVLLTRRVSDPDEAVPGMALLPLICAALLLPLQPFVWVPFSAADLGLVAVMACLGTASHVCLQIGLRSGPASVLSPFLYSQVIFAAILGVVFFADPLGLWFGLGTVLIVGGGLAIWWIECGRVPRDNNRKTVR